MHILKTPFIKITHDNIWLSELFSGVLVALGGIFIVSFSILFLVYQKNLEKLQIEMQKEKATKVILENQLSLMENKAKIYSGIQHLRGFNFSPLLAKKLTDLLAQNSRNFGYDPLLLLAVINVESQLHHNAMGQFKSGNYSGALGLMQLKFETACDMAKKLDIRLKSSDDLFKPEINIPLGIYYLTKMVVEFKSFGLGVLAYNYGPGNLWKGMRGEIPFSTSYYHKVMQSYTILKNATEI
jgi:soluble lytic murein transglycosylase-like protein